MEKYDFEASIGYWIAVTFHVYQQRLNEALVPFGITFRQFQVLAWLAHEGELSQSELVDRLLVEPPTLVGILDRMQREGWIERHCSDVDRRRKQIRLRDDAQVVWGQVVQCLRSAREEATRGMSDEEVGLLRELLGRVHDNLLSSDDRGSHMMAQKNVGFSPTAGTNRVEVQ